MPDNSKSQAHSRVSQCDGLTSIQSNKQNGPQMFKQICQVVHPSCRSICHSSEPQSSIVCISSSRPTCLGHRCSEHNLVGSHCLCLPSHGSPSYGDPKIRQLSCLISVIAPGWPGMPWFRDLVQLSTEIPLHFPVSTTLLKKSHNQVFHSNPQHLNLHAWCLGVDSSKTKASLWKWQKNCSPSRSSTRTIYKSKWALFEKWCRENLVDFSTPFVKQVSDFFMYLYQDQNRPPSTFMVTGRPLLTP